MFSDNQGVKYLLYVIDVITKYTWLKPLKDERIKAVFLDFIEIVNESKRKPNTFLVDQGREFYNSLMQKWLHCNS